MSLIKQQRGAALILMFLVLLSILLTVFVSRLNPAQRRAENLQNTQIALHRAKQLLLAYAARRHGRESDSSAEVRELQLARPGELTCPDFNNDGVMNGPLDDYSGADCRRRVGWFAFESFDSPRFVAGDGSAIWYAVANGFYNRSGLAGYSETVINTTTTTGMSLDGRPVVAVLIASGQALPGQNQRQADNAAVAQSSFLDQQNGVSEDSFISLSASGGFNDVVLGISLAELMRAIEPHAAQAIAKRLNQYFIDNGSYPYAANAAGDCDIATSSLSGDVPLRCFGVASSQPSLPFPSPAATDAEDVWLVRNQWLPQFSYERLAANHIRLSSRYADTQLRPIEFIDALQRRI